MRSFRWWTLPAALITMAALAAPATAGHDADPRTDTVHPKGHILYPASLIDPAALTNDINTDIAFWGQHAFLGNWDGFRIVDIADPDNPTEVSRTFCDGNQGDVAVWDNVLVRAWNTPAGTTGPFGAGTTCDGVTALPSTLGPFEGVNVFDISDLSNPELVASVETLCGSHTLTLVPDTANDRVLVYNSPSSAAVGCTGLDIIEVPLDDPATASYLRFESSGGPGDVPAPRSCHDTGVILGDEMKASCAGGNGFTTWSLDPADGGSLEDPLFLYSIAEPGVTIGHSAGFTWDGDVLIFGHEPGGGVQAECEVADDVVKKSYFFYDSDTGAKLGSFLLPRSQSSSENCTLHNFNVVPLRDGDDVLIHASYQAGFGVVDFNDLSGTFEVGWNDPPPIPIPPGSPFCAPVGCEIGGDWSTYWYNNFIYESSITEGFNVFRFSGDTTAGAMRLDHLNPNTQEFTIG